MTLLKYINLKKEIYEILIEFIENQNSEECETKYIEILEKLDFLNLDKNVEELVSMFRLIAKISNNHHRNYNFIKKIEQMILLLNQKSKQSISNSQLFYIFAINKLTIQILFRNNLIKMDSSIVDYIIQRDDYRYFFYFEIKSYINEEQQKSIEKELNLIDPNILKILCTNHDLSENDSYICSLIREDLVEEFISYVNKTNLSLSSTIKPSIFETNSFLQKQENTTLIEYSAFFGSIQIFNYLRLNNVQLTPSLWMYAIHSNNAELIHLLEENHIQPEDPSYEDCFFESIKCHHNNFANYIHDNLLTKKEHHSKYKHFYNYSIRYIIPKSPDCSCNEIIFKYQNYSLFPENFDLKDIFFYLYRYGYSNIVNFLLQMKMDNINSRASVY
ncbi:hypothetical protein M9Y10_038654 [Tritrichomonas musculus]|uniref:DUF3447 domain-containing protein n=1 Tax=Tritrichomonas musculus TaxID=1915356 RepID=A0ABR2K900_9EUKA